VDGLGGMCFGIVPLKNIEGKQVKDKELKERFV
jgi:hypothetical protein